MFSSLSSHLLYLCFLLTIREIWFVWVVIFNFDLICIWFGRKHKMITEVWYVHINTAWEAQGREGSRARTQAQDRRGGCSSSCSGSWWICLSWASWEKGSKGTGWGNSFREAPLLLMHQNQTFIIMQPIRPYIFHLLPYMFFALLMFLCL